MELLDKLRIGGEEDGLPHELRICEDQIHGFAIGK
jgi:hypothetical protein